MYLFKKVQAIETWENLKSICLSARKKDTKLFQNILKSDKKQICKIEDQRIYNKFLNNFRKCR